MNESFKRGMKKKTIESLIKIKIDDWVDSILPENYSPEQIEQFHKNIKQNIIVTGGSIASMLIGESVNDYDVYFKDKDIAKQVALYYVNRLAKKSGIEDLSVSSQTNNKVSRIFVEDTENGVSVNIKSMGILSDTSQVADYSYFELMPYESVQNFFKSYSFTQTEKEKYNPAFITSNAITLHDDIQIITRFVGQPEDIHKYFDFIHCTNYFTFDTGLVLNQPALESLMARELRYTGSLFPVCSVLRLRKFIKRGWVITAGEIFKICYDISKLDFENLQVLQDQLTGVDNAYFLEVINKLKNDRDIGIDIDRTYLFTIISEIFDEDI